MIAQAEPTTEPIAEPPARVVLADLPRLTGSFAGHKTRPGNHAKHLAWAKRNLEARTIQTLAEDGTTITHTVYAVKGPPRPHAASVPQVKHPMQVRYENYCQTMRDHYIQPTSYRSWSDNYLSVQARRGVTT